MKELSIESIRLSLMNYQRVVILREKEADRYLPIWIGPGEADAIAVRLQDVAVARPMTHDLLRNLIEQLGGRVAYIVVNDLANDTFFARIVLDVHGRDDGDRFAAIGCDRAGGACRSADLTPKRRCSTVRAWCWMRMASRRKRARRRPSAASWTPAELERLGAFKDFIEGLDLDDFDERKK